MGKKMILKKLFLLFVITVITSGMTFVQAKTKITFMTPLSGADGGYMDQIIQKFNKANPDIEVVHLVVGDSVEYKQKLSTGLTTKSAPQVLLIRKFDMPQYLNQLKSFSSKELKNYGIDINDVYPNLMDGLEKKGKILGVPLDVWIFYMAYNKANFKKAGLNPNKPPMTKAEFIKDMEALKTITPKGITPYYESPVWSWIWVHFLWQYGGDLLSKDYKKPAFEKAGTKALEMMVDFQKRGIMPKALVDAGPVFQNGQGSVLITGIWTINPWLSAMKKDFGYSVAPQLGTTKAVFGGSHVIALPNIMNKDKKVLKASMEWVKYLWDHAIDWYAAGQTPSRKSIAESSELKNRLPQIYTVAQQMKYVKTFQMFPYISEVLSEISVYLEAVLITQKMTPEEGMQKASVSVQKILDDYWDTH